MSKANPVIFAGVDTLLFAVKDPEYILEIPKFRLSVFKFTKSLIVAEPNDELVNTALFALNLSAIKLPLVNDKLPSVPVIHADPE